jgi:hypothetical protein
MKRTDYSEAAIDSSRKDNQIAQLAAETAHPAEEFIGLDGVGEFPEWRSPEEDEEEFSIRTRRIV